MACRFSMQRKFYVVRYAFGTFCFLVVGAAFVGEIAAAADLIKKSAVVHDMKPQGEFPESWWAPIPRDQAESWEILPQDASPPEVILSKRTELGILSNFAATPFVYEGKTFASLEGFWQAMKYPESDSDPRATFPGIVWPHKRMAVESMVAFEAKRAGDVGSENMKKMAINWVSLAGVQMPYRVLEKGAHYDVIVKATWAKIEQNPEVKRILLATKNLILRPDHHQGTDVPPAWKYYDIYMEIRSKLLTSDPEFRLPNPTPEPRP